MDELNRTAPKWTRPFLQALREGHGVREACRIAGVCSSTPYHRRRADDAFRAEWDAIQPVDGRARPASGPRPRRDQSHIDQFLDELAHSSNVAAAAAVSGLSTGQAYKLRRNDPDFARRWYAALAEGYDNLEMDLLARLREGRMEEVGEDGIRRKYDFATALRCLSAHRETVATEKGRRTLAEEAATIASINAKIDALRARAREGAAQARKAKQALARRVKSDGAE